MKKTIFSTLIFPTLCYANMVTGVGEFYFGPDTSENIACEYAFQKSKQDALQKVLGEEIESFTKENCTSETKCSIDVETYTQMFGRIKQVLKKDVNVYRDYGKKVCRVVINSVVEKIDNRITFNVTGKLDYFENEEIDFSVISNKQGYVSVFMYRDNTYIKLYDFPLTKLNTEIKVKGDGEKIRISLPKNTFQSKDLFVFLFSKERPIDKKRLTYFEFSNIMDTLDPKFKKTIHRYVTVGKKIEKDLPKSTEEVVYITRSLSIRGN